MAIAGVIYLITNTVNGKRYVGQTQRKAALRFNAYKNTSKRLNPHGALHRAMKKYGVDKFEMVEICSVNDIKFLDDLERFFINEFNSLTIGHGYNCETGGCRNKTHGPETRALISAKRKGGPPGWPKGKPLRDDIKQLLSEQASIRLSDPTKNGMYGKKQSPESIAKNKASQKRVRLQATHNQTGDQIIFESTREAERAGFFYVRVFDVIKGKYKHYKGYSWKKI